MPVADLRFVVDGEPQPADAIRMPRFDIAVRHSGFWGVVPVTAAGDAEAVVLEAEFRARGGSGWERVELGRIAVARTGDGVSEDARRPGLIAICMGSYNPDPELLARQIESIRDQTDSEWVCVISDDHSDPERFDQLLALTGGDERFTVSRAPSRIGFYRNFERALWLAPPAAGLIALSDQDDVWHPDKLATLRQSLGSAALVYSDQRLVDERGELLRDTMWRRRANNWTNLASLLIANTVTGAAALFRRDVAEQALPFPDSPGIEFHDHWIALTAMTNGELRYVAGPLYDYVQHEAAVLGKVGGGHPQRVQSTPLAAHRLAGRVLPGPCPGQGQSPDATRAVRTSDRAGQAAGTRALPGHRPLAARSDLAARAPTPGAGRPHRDAGHGVGAGPRGGVVLAGPSARAVPRQAATAGHAVSGPAAL